MFGIKKLMFPIIAVIVIAIATFFVVIVAVMADGSLTTGISYFDEADRAAAVYRVIEGCKSVESLAPKEDDDAATKVKAEHDQKIAQIILDIKGDPGSVFYIDKNGNTDVVQFSLAVATYEELANRKNIYLDDEEDAKKLMQNLIDSLYEKVVSTGNSSNSNSNTNVSTDSGGNIPNVSGEGCAGYTNEYDAETAQLIVDIAWRFYNDQTRVGVCNEFYNAVYSEVQMPKSGNSSAQAAAASDTCVTPENLKPGDVIFWRDKGSNPSSSFTPGVNGGGERKSYFEVGHVAIYVGNGQVLETVMRSNGNSIVRPRLNNIWSTSSYYPIMYTRPYAGSNIKVVNVDTSKSASNFKEALFNVLEVLQERHKDITLTKDKDNLLNYINLKAQGLQHELEQKGCDSQYSCVAYENGETRFVEGRHPELTMYPIAFPLDPTKIVTEELEVTSDFNDTENRKSSHNAIDIAAPTGTDVFAMFSGTVQAITKKKSSCGYGVTILHDSAKYNYTYCHLNEAPLVSKGEHVSMGQLIGKSGNTGNSTGPHLHIQVTSSAGKYWNILPSLVKALEFALDNDCTQQVKVKPPASLVSCGSLSIENVDNLPSNFVAPDNLQSLGNYTTHSKTTGFGYDCSSCGSLGNLQHGLNAGGVYERIYYNDPEYGPIRIITSGGCNSGKYSGGFGSILKITENGGKYTQPYLAIMLDCGSPNSVDVLFPTESMANNYYGTHNFTAEVIREGLGSTGEPSSSNLITWEEATAMCSN